MKLKTQFLSHLATFQVPSSCETSSVLSPGDEVMLLGLDGCWRASGLGFEKPRGDSDCLELEGDTMKFKSTDLAPAWGSDWSADRRDAGSWELTAGIHALERALGPFMQEALGSIISTVWNKQKWWEWRAGAGPWGLAAQGLHWVKPEEVEESYGEARGQDRVGREAFKFEVTKGQWAEISRLWTRGQRDGGHLSMVDTDMGETVNQPCHRFWPGYVKK